MKKDEVYTDIEYMQFLQRGKSLLVLKGDEINGKTKLELQTLAGKELGEGVYTVTENRRGSLTNKTYKMRTIVFGNKAETIKKSDDNERLIEIINALSAKVERIESTRTVSGPAPAMETILELTKQNYIMQIEFLKNQLTGLEARYTALEKKYERLKEESEDNSGTDILGALNAVQQLKGLKNNGAALHDNTNGARNDIPTSWINALGKIDFNKLSEKDQNEYLNIFEQFAKQLPMKEV